jgi:hypothetical protein
MYVIPTVLSQAADDRIVQVACQDESPEQLEARQSQAHRAIVIWTSLSNSNHAIFFFPNN